MMIIMRLTISSISFWSDNFRQIIIIFHKFKRFKCSYILILKCVPAFGEYKNDENHYDFFSSFHIDSFRETQTCAVRSTHLTPRTKVLLQKIGTFSNALVSLLLGWYAFALDNVFIQNSNSKSLFAPWIWTLQKYYIILVSELTNPL